MSSFNRYIQQQMKYKLNEMHSSTDFKLSIELKHVKYLWNCNGNYNIKEYDIYVYPYFNNIALLDKY